MPYATNPDDNVRIHYEVEGDGPPLLFFHGGMISGQSWRDFGFVDALKDRYQTILIDGRGHGNSDKPHDAAAYVVTRQLTDVIAVLDDLGIDQTHYCGYSSGGRMGFFLARYAPERVRSFIVIDQTALEIPPVEDPGSQLRDGMAAWVERFEQAHGPLTPELRPVFLADDAEALIAFNQGLQLQPSSDDGIFGEQNVPSYQQGLSLEDDVTQIDAPCLMVVAGQNRGSSQVYSRAPVIAEAMPDARYVPLEDLNHMEIIQRSDLLLPHISAFLERVEQERTE